MAEVPKSVIQKLIFFSVAMIFGPIVSFFVAQNYYEMPPLKCGLLAAAVANVVVVGYVVAAFMEDVPTKPVRVPESEKNTKKNR